MITQEELKEFDYAINDWMSLRSPMDSINDYFRDFGMLIFLLCLHLNKLMVILCNEEQLPKVVIIKTD